MGLEISINCEEVRISVDVVGGIPLGEPLKVSVDCKELVSISVDVGGTLVGVG